MRELSVYAGSNMHNYSVDIETATALWFECQSECVKGVEQCCC